MTQATPPALTLYLSPGSSSMAPHIALHEIGAAFDTVSLSFAAKDARRPDFLALNPEGKVPVLVVDGNALTEVAAILYYLARRFPEASLWPAGDLAAESHALSWMSFCAATVHPARGRGQEHARTIFAIADRRLGNHAWAVGQYSIADIHLFRLFWRLRNAIQPAPGDFPNLTAHHERMMARDAVRRTLAIEAAIGYELPA